MERIDAWGIPKSDSCSKIDPSISLTLAYTLNGGGKEPFARQREAHQRSAARKKVSSGLLPASIARDGKIGNSIGRERC